MVKKHSTETIANKIKEATNNEYILVGEYHGAHIKVRIKHLLCGNFQEVRLGHFLEGTMCKTCRPSNRKSADEFLAEVKQLVGDEYTFLEKYITSQTNIKVTHTVCNHIYSVRPANFLSGKRCPKCANNIKFTNQEFKKQIFELVGDEYSVIGEYVNTLTKIAIRHNICSNIINITPGSFKLGARCSYCNGGAKVYDSSSYSDYVRDCTHGEYLVSGEYVNAITHMTFTHTKCRNSYRATPTVFQSGRRCPYCYGHMKKDTDTFKSEVFKLVDAEYSVLGDYINYFCKVKMRHNLCNHEYQVTPASFIGSKNRPGSRCPSCYKNEKKTTDAFKIELRKVVGDEYNVVGSYEGANKKIDILHTTCGRVYSPTPSNILRGLSNCPCESENKGESRVLAYLKNHDISFQRQYSEPNCRYKAPLRFDFSIFDKKDKVLCLIEYDGKQHFEPIEYFGGRNAFKHQQKKDKIKTDYCKAKNIPLIRIPYWDYGIIETILDDELTKLGVLHSEYFFQ